jgi:tetratricopeptide (TPR) repeat protein
MNIGRILSLLAVSSIVGVTSYVIASKLAQRSSTTPSSMTKVNNNSSSISASAHSNTGLNTLFDSAREYYVKGDYKNADIFFERVLEIEPNHIETLNGRGTLLLYRLADYDKARNCFEKVLQVDPKNVVALNSMEILNNKKGGTSQQKQKPAPPPPSPPPSVDTRTSTGADPRNPYNDPTLPYYNPDLDKKRADDTSQQKQKPAPPPPPSPPPSSSSGTTSGVDPRNPYNDPTLPYYNPDLDKKK